MGHRTRIACLLLVFGLPAAAVAFAQDAGNPDESPGANIRVTVTLGDVEAETGPTVRTYKMLLRDGGPRVRMLMGWRTPIPTTSKPDEEGKAPLLSYIYQNVGMTAQLACRILPDGRVATQGAIEISGARPAIEGVETPSHMPIIGTFQQDLDLTLRVGVPLRVAEVPDPEGGTMYLELAAEILED
jgi:hypothetical protein